MSRHLETRLRSLERTATGYQPSCAACRNWMPEVLYEGDPEPVQQCTGCGRSRPADLFVVRFIARDDGPQ